MSTLRQLVVPLGRVYADAHLIAPHTHERGQLVFAVRGVMRVNTDEASWLVPPSRALWMPPGVRHAISMRGVVSMNTLYLDPISAPAWSRCRAVEVGPLLRELVRHVVRTGPLNAGDARHERVAALLRDLLHDAPAASLSLPWPRDRRALSVAESIVTDPGARVSLRALVAQAGASLRTVQRVFVSQTGVTLEAWRQTARLLRAVELLDAGHSVTATALDCGYGSTSAFVTAFRRRLGITPAAHKRRGAGEFTRDGVRLG